MRGEKREAKLGLPNIGDTTPVAYCMRQLYYLQCLTVSLTLFSSFHVDIQDKRLLYYIGSRHPVDTVGDACGDYGNYTKESNRWGEAAPNPNDGRRTNSRRCGSRLKYVNAKHRRDFGC